MTSQQDYPLYLRMMVLLITGETTDGAKLLLIRPKALHECYQFDYQKLFYQIIYINYLHRSDKELI